MRFAFIDDYRPAVVADRGVVDVSHVLDSIPKLDAQDLLEGLVQRFDEFRPLLEEAAANGEATPVDQVRFRPPVPRPGKMVCMAGNYLEGGTIPRAYDVDAFLKAPSSVIGDGDTVVLPNVPAAVFHHEAELGVVIGKEMKSVDASDALSHVFGYLNFMDVSARGITPNGNNSFWWQKSWDTFGPIGPWIVTADEIAEHPETTDTPMERRGPSTRLQHVRHGEVGCRSSRMGVDRIDFVPRRHCCYRDQPPRPGADARRRNGGPGGRGARPLERQGQRRLRQNVGA